MPLICCSMTWTTVSCTVCAEAPGYVTVIAMEGGAMLGYCATGSFLIARMPARVMMMAITQAKIGRAIKNPDMGVTSGGGSARCRSASRRSLTGFNRSNLVAGVCFLQPRDDHPVARLDAVDHQPLIPHHPTGLQPAQLNPVHS